METIIIFILIILVASILQTSTGFGFSIMATPFLLLLFSPQEAIQINIILSLVISISLIWKIKADIDVTLLKRFSIGSVIGVPFGILIFLSINIKTFKIAVSIILLAFTLLLIFHFKIKGTCTPATEFPWYTCLSTMANKSLFLLEVMTCIRLRDFFNILRCAFRNNFPASFSTSWT